MYMKPCTLKRAPPKIKKLDLLVFADSAETEELLERFDEELSGRRLHELELHQILDPHDLELQHRPCLTTATFSQLFDHCQFQSSV